MLLDSYKVYAALILQLMNWEDYLQVVFEQSEVLREVGFFFS